MYQWIKDTFGYFENKNYFITEIMMDELFSFM